MSWHSRSPSVIKHGTAVTLRHPRQTGWDNESLSLGSVGIGGWHREGPGAGRATMAVGWLGLGSGLSPAHPFQTVLLDSTETGA